MTITKSPKPGNNVRIIIRIINKMNSKSCCFPFKGSFAVPILIQDLHFMTNVIDASKFIFHDQADKVPSWFIVRM